MNPASLPDVFLTVVSASWRGGLLILLFIALRPLARGRIPAQIWFAAWIVVAVRLLIPFSIPAAWSPYNLVARWPSAAPVAPAVVSSPAATAGVSSLAEAPSPSPEQIAVPAVAASPAATLDVRQPAPARNWTGVEILACGWIAGVVLLVAARFAGSWQLRRRLRHARVMTQDRLARILAGELSALPGRPPVCFETDAVNAPALFGILRPRLLFPPGLVEKLTDDELRLVVRHELGHWRRRDLLAQWLLHLAVILHWFNPLAWYAAWLARIDCELACDEFVLRGGSSSGADAYAAALLKVLGVVRSRPHAFGVVGILENKERLAHRLGTIASYRPASAGRVMAGVALLIGFGVASLTRESLAAEKAGPPNAPGEARDGLAAATPNAASADEPAAAIEAARKHVEQMARDFQEDKEARQAAMAEASRTRTAVDAAKARLDQVAVYRTRGGDLATLPFIAGNALVSQLTQQVAAHRITVATLSATYADKHPKMVAATNLVGETEKELRRSVDAVCQTLEADYQAALRSSQETARQLALLNQTSDARLRQLQAAEQNFEAAVMRFREAAKAGDALPNSTAPSVPAPTLGGAGWRLSGGLGERTRGGGTLSISGRDVAVSPFTQPIGDAATIMELQRKRIEEQARELESYKDKIGVVTLDKGVSSAAWTLSTASGAQTKGADDFVVSVVGAVHQQGAFDFSQNQTPIALDAIARAGGFTPEAARAALRILRANPDGSRMNVVLTEAEVMGGGPSSKLRRGDLIIVPREGESSNGQVLVMGAVNVPGAYDISRDKRMTLINLLAKAGGVTRPADLKKVRVTRIDVQNKSTKVVTVDLDGFLKGSADTDPNANWDAFVPQPGDIVSVPEKVF